MYKPREHSDLGELSADTASPSGPESSTFLKEIDSEKFWCSEK